MPRPDGPPPPPPWLPGALVHVLPSDHALALLGENGLTKKKKKGEKERKKESQQNGLSKCFWIINIMVAFGRLCGLVSQMMNSGLFLHLGFSSLFFVQSILGLDQNSFGPNGLVMGHKSPIGVSAIKDIITYPKEGPEGKLSNRNRV